MTRLTLKCEEIKLKEAVDIASLIAKKLGFAIEIEFKESSDGYVKIAPQYSAEQILKAIETLYGILPDHIVRG